MRKLVIFIPSIETGGVEKNLYEILNYFKKKFSNIYFVSADRVKLSINNKKNFTFLNKKNVKFRKRLFKSFFCFFLLLKYFRNERILIFSFQSNFFVFILSFLIDAKLIFRLNTSLEKYSNNFIKDFLFNNIYKKADAIIVNSNDFKKKLFKKFNLGSHLILNTISKKKDKKKKINFFKDYKYLKILTIGRLTKQKNHICLLRSLKLLNENYKLKFRCCIIGQGKEFKNLQKYTTINNLQKFVKFSGYKKNAYQFMSDSDLFVLSSKFEGLPNVLIESQKMKLPIISSNCPTGPKEILKNGKFGDLYEVDDHEMLAKKIFKFYSNKNILKKKSKKAYKYLNRFDRQKNLNKYYVLIRKLIKN